MPEADGANRAAKAVARDCKREAATVMPCMTNLLFLDGF